jgi:spermidine synthase
VWRYGRQVSLRVDGLTQSGGLMEEIWEKALKAVYSQRLSVNRILILGLGGGTAAKVVKKYWPQAQITGVEIDPVMVELGKQYLGLTGVKIIISDAVKFVEETEAEFDGIIVDLYQGRKIPKVVQTKGFINKLKKLGKWIIFNRLKTDKAFREQLNESQVIKTPANELLLVK